MTKKKDLRRKVTSSMASRMTKMVEKGKTYKEIAEKFNVSAYAVKYNTNAEFRTSEIARIAAY